MVCSFWPLCCCCGNEVQLRQLSRGVRTGDWAGQQIADSIHGPGAYGVKDGLHVVAAMARSTNRSAEEGESRVSAPADRGEARDLAEPRELSLEEVLKSYEQPINEEQAWAVCYQCCSGLRVPRPPAGTASGVKDPSSILLHRDGTVSIEPQCRHSGRTADFLTAGRCLESFTQNLHMKKFNLNI